MAISWVTNGYETTGYIKKLKLFKIVEEKRKTSDPEEFCWKLISFLPGSTTIYLPSCWKAKDEASRILDDFIMYLIL